MTRTLLFSLLSAVTIAGNTIETKNYGTVATPEPTVVVIPAPTFPPQNEVVNNQLSQTFHNSEGKIHKIGFWYNFETSETLTGFGEPAFVVKINNEVVHQVWASDAQLQVTKDLRETSWRFLT